MIIWLCWRLIAVGWFVLLVQLLFTMFGLNNVVAVVGVVGILITLFFDYGFVGVYRSRLVIR